MDFDDLLFRSVNLFEHFPEVRDRYRDSFRYLLVDEYQDTNRAQYRWLQRSPRSTATCAPSATTTSRSTAGAAPTSATSSISRATTRSPQVMLEQNYRSTQSILAAADAVIGHNRSRRDKTLWSDRRGRPRACARDERAEARFVVPRSSAASRRALGDFVVFYRTNAQSRVFEEECLRAGAYSLIGGPKFYERKEIKDVLAYLTLLNNPQDTVAFGRVVNSPQARDRRHLPGPDHRLRQHHRRAGVRRGCSARGNPEPGRRRR